MDGVYESLRLVLWQRLVEYRSMHTTNSETAQHG